MNRFDFEILQRLNQLGDKSPSFDSVCLFLVDSQLFKGVTFVLVLWWLWFYRGERRTKNREIIIATLFATFVAIVLGRLMATRLPYRTRPLYDPNLHFPSYDNPTFLGLRAWSAFPSDHAMMFATLATGIFFISPVLGTAAFAYQLALIDFPRTYLGFHHPTDVIAGALIGIVVGWAFNRNRLRTAIAAPVLRFHDRHEGAFYALAFLISTQIASMFGEPRTIMMGLMHWAKGHH